jgi:light-regulated signal transduction histidine kinase (bacteriophytochrome)
VEIFPNFYVQNKRKFVTVESIKNDQFVYLNGNQIFDQNLLIDFDQNSIQNAVSFEGYAIAYNRKIQVIKARQNALSLFSVNNDCDEYDKFSYFK